MVQQADGKAWLPPALTLVALVTLYRLVLLPLDHTDLFADEAQYWLWGQHFDFGYFSKPPLIAWLIGGVTWLAQSDTAFWIRMPAAVLHGATALILGALAMRLGGRSLSLWTVAAYLTLPLAAVGSLLISTDTVMAPFFAAGLLFHHRLMKDRRLIDAALVGLMAGLACLAKYAGVYLLIGVGLAALIDRRYRPRLRETVVILGLWLLVLAPNLVWNLRNGLTTIAHTGQNIGWIENSQPLSHISFEEVLEFWSDQLAVMGPLTLIALLIGLRRVRQEPFLASFALTPLVIVTGQALLDRAIANWAVGSYFSGAILAMRVLEARPRWRLAALSINGVVCLLLPLLTIFSDLGLQGKPLLQRYLGRAEMSRTLIGMAEAAGGVPIVSDNRDVMADLFYTGRDADIPFYAVPAQGRPATHYEASYPLPGGLSGQVLLVTQRQPQCDATPMTLPRAGTAYAKLSLRAWLVTADCARRPMPPG